MVRHHHRRDVRLIAGMLAATLMPLPTIAADARRGEVLAIDATKGNCAICHAFPSRMIPPGAAGDIGPPLDGVASRYSSEELRSRIENPKADNPQTIMPAYAVTEGLTRVDHRYTGKPILTQAEIDDVVAYLLTLK
jgi:L-cysteine S-thiosulfotransferase